MPRTDTAAVALRPLIDLRADARAAPGLLGEAALLSAAGLDPAGWLPWHRPGRELRGLLIRSGLVGPDDPLAGPEPVIARADRAGDAPADPGELLWAARLYRQLGRYQQSAATAGRITADAAPELRGWRDLLLAECAGGEPAGRRTTRPARAEFSAWPRSWPGSRRHRRPTSSPPPGGAPTSSPKAGTGPGPGADPDRAAERRRRRDGGRAVRGPGALPRGRPRRLPAPGERVRAPAGGRRAGPGRRGWPGRRPARAGRARARPGQRGRSPGRGPGGRRHAGHRGGPPAVPQRGPARPGRAARGPVRARRPGHLVR